MRKWFVALAASAGLVGLGLFGITRRIAARPAEPEAPPAGRPESLVR